jgi:quinohemoprotein ethanol dehydrogenase
VIAMLIALANLAPCADTIDHEAIAAERLVGDWPSYGRGFSENRFSPLRQINVGSIDRLRLAWSLDLPDINSVASQPLEVDGTLYFAVGRAVVHAVNASSGKLLWRYDPEVAKHANHKTRWSFGSRGLAFWKKKVYVGTEDGRLICLDAKTGALLWSRMTVEAGDDRFITGAPRVFGGKVIIGHAGGDVGITRGYVTTYDAETGRQLWRFYTVPGNPANGFENAAMERAARTWADGWWKLGGGGAVWNAITYDAELNRFYIGTGNGLPWNRKIRSPGGGDNLFLSSIVALDAGTGAYLWHYQLNPGDSWDYDATMDMILTDLSITGRSYKVLMQAPKNGFFYVIDRSSGKLLSAERFTKVTWAERIDVKTGRPVELDGSRYETGESLVYPGVEGGHTLAAMSYSPKAGLVYIPTIESPGLFDDAGLNPAGWVSKAHTFNFGIRSVNADGPADSCSSALLAWNPVAQKAAWQIRTPGCRNGGTIATAGDLVFQGHPNGEFSAYTTVGGRKVWSFNAGNGIVSGPITYAVKGRQYVSVLTGMGGGAGAAGSVSAQFGWQARVHPRRLLTFTLNGKGVLPAAPLPAQAVPIDDPQFVVDAGRAQRGNELFGVDCMTCHGPGAVAGGTAPDLRASAVAIEPAAFGQVVQQGVLQSRGMPAFPELTADDLESIRHYLRQRARESLTDSTKVKPTPADAGRASVNQQ